MVLALALVLASRLDAETIRCAECGMAVDTENRFSSKIVQGGKTLLFCDVGDMLIYQRDKKAGMKNAWVKNYGTGEWTSAETAYYVYSPKRFSTPMGWSIATFKDKKDAEEFGTPLDKDGIMVKLK